MDFQMHGTYLISYMIMNKLLLVRTSKQDELSDQCAIVIPTPARSHPNHLMTRAITKLRVNNLKDEWSRPVFYTNQPILTSAEWNTNEDQSSPITAHNAQADPTPCYCVCWHLASYCVTVCVGTWQQGAEAHVDQSRRTGMEARVQWRRKRRRRSR